MSEDIVTRLMFFSLDDGADALNKILSDAVYELESLRADRDRWRKIADELYTWLDLSYNDESVHEAGLKAITIYEQAVRGE